MNAPTSEEAVAALVQQACRNGTSFSIEGGGTRSTIPGPVQSDETLSLSGLNGVTLYEPAEMVIGAWAGTPVSALEAKLAENNQLFSFEPPDYRAVLGTHGEPSIGGVVAGNLSGPRRVLAGAARDNLIGVRFVNGRGEIIKNGGRVMKNVTGLDLVKLQAGSWGTLGVLTQVIFKVIPRPPEGRTLVVHGLSEAEGVALLGKAMGTPFEVNGAAHLPAGIQGAEAQTLMRLEGFPEQFSHRMPALMQAIDAKGEIISGAEHQALWNKVRDLTPFAQDLTPALWRISCPPMAGPSLVAAIRAHRPVRAMYDWSGGLVWLETSLEEEAGAGIIRQACAAYTGAHATLLRAPASLKARVPVFNPLAPAHLALTKAIKASLDPQGLFNPGVMDGV